MKQNNNKNSLEIELIFSVSKPHQNHCFMKEVGLNI